MRWLHLVGYRRCRQIILKISHFSVEITFKGYDMYGFQFSSIFVAFKQRRKKIFFSSVASFIVSCFYKCHLCSWMLCGARILIEYKWIPMSIQMTSMLMIMTNKRSVFFCSYHLSVFLTLFISTVVCLFLHLQSTAFFFCLSTHLCL